MNEFDETPIDRTSFSYRDLLAQDLWSAFTVAATLTVVGTPTYVGRYRIVGKSCGFQISAVSTTSIASTAGTHYFALPIVAKGIGGAATMMNLTTNIAVGTCVVEPTTSRCWLPAQAASGDKFAVVGSYEIG